MDEDDKEGDLILNQRKERTDLNAAHSQEWGKFLERRAAYARQYGEADAARLLKKEEQALVEKMNQEHKKMDDRNDQQWLAHFNGEDPDPVTPAPASQAKRPPEAEKDLTDTAAELLRKYREQQTRRQQEKGHGHEQ